MRINNNMMAVNTHRQLNMNQAQGSKSLEKLSSGLRINRAGDDAAGLAISEKMRGQIRGLNQATRNAQDGISLIQTAEGALNETHAILQRMRELAVQAATDTNTTADRGEIQKEFDELAKEITRIADNTEFNSQKLLDGSFTGKSLHIGSNAAQSLSVGIAKSDATQLGVGTGGVTYTGGTVSAVSGTASNVAVTMGTYAGNNVSDLAVDTTGLTVTPTTTYNMGGASAAVTGDASGLVVGVGAYDGPNASVAVDTTGLTIDTAYTSLEPLVTGSTVANTYAELNITWTQAVAEDVGDALTTQFTVGGASSADWSVTGNAAGIITLSHTSGDTFTYDATGLATGVASTNFGFTEAQTTFGGTITIDGDTVNIAADGTGSVASGDFTGLTVDASGTTANQTGTLAITGVVENTTNAYGGSITVAGQSVNIAADGTGSVGSGSYSGLAVDVTGAAAAQTGTFSITGRTESAAQVAGIDVSTDAAAANAAITAIDSAITAVSTQRSALGAVQNRLEHTISNLGTSSENLQAAESRIRDVDMAAEMMQFTKNNILQQAATAMLAQANQAPQMVLQLLR